MLRKCNTRSCSCRSTVKVITAVSATIQRCTAAVLLYILTLCCYCVIPSVYTAHIAVVPQAHHVLAELMESRGAFKLALKQERHANEIFRYLPQHFEQP
jgi:hypothetical protein